MLTATFPDIRVVVNPPLQMARSLADLQRRNGAASSADMETMLGNFKAAAPDAPAPSALDFVAGELRMKGLDASAAAVAAISTRLAPQGYSLRQEADGLLMKEERVR